MATQTFPTNYSEPSYTQVEDRKKYPFYHIDISHKIPPETEELLEKYSHIPKDEQGKHIHDIRDRAFDIRAYPCIGLGSWLVPQLRRNPAYPEILQRAKNGATIIDIGTFLGHDLRRLVYDGAPSDKLYGNDIVNLYDIGYDFFRDRESFKGPFIEADFLSTDNAELNALRGKVDVIIISQVLHQWDWVRQVEACKALITFTKTGSIIAGNQIGNLEARETSHVTLKVSTYKHNPESFAKLWEEASKATGTKWECQAWMRVFPEMGWDQKDAAWMDHDTRIMEFEAKRAA